MALLPLPHGDMARRPLPVPAFAHILSLDFLVSRNECGIRMPQALGRGLNRFIPEKEILQVESEDSEMHALFADLFAALEHLDNIILVMVFHLQYL